ncbi:MAG: response regulator transcription factor [Bacteroidetes bacterium]|uniref:Response regulator transcription factor n=1 Tax=Phaeocystidibacter marisrubri TaxID=1577780 RepID=A0A6L3ZC75_9FLAO|nr:response regulator transcription factor [Phaeocystidibacter marisrubri]KAB2815236.1 response regulator transcription factor [Phaeocystidibacter marisrubri]TNE27263.1 MAG: response regulator transcription factor [Bacteroidota bacterium]GGH71033.1 DNA-binding response regulator [Phaeocystidibacter marisrubri]
MSKEKIRVVLAEDQQLIRAALVNLINSLIGVVVVAEASDGVELLNILDTTPCDIVITDIRMPKMDGIEAVGKIAEYHPELGVIGLSQYDDNDIIVEFIRAGGRAFLLKNADPTEVELAIEKVHETGQYLNQKVSQSLFQNSFRARRRRKSSLLSGVTEREVEILNLLSKEHTAVEMAEKLNISSRTVEKHISHLHQKFETKKTIGLVLCAIREGIIQIEM